MPEQVCSEVPIEGVYEGEAGSHHSRKSQKAKKEGSRVDGLGEPSDAVREQSPEAVGPAPHEAAPKDRQAIEVVAEVAAHRHGECQEALPEANEEADSSLTGDIGFFLTF